MLNSFRSCPSDSNLTTNSSDLECENWKNEHIVLTTDLHFFNMTFTFIKIDSLDDLNITLDQRFSTLDPRKNFKKKKHTTSLKKKIRIFTHF